MIRIKVNTEKDDFHPQDDADTDCGGNNVFCKRFPAFDAWQQDKLQTVKDFFRQKKNRDIYALYLKEHPEAEWEEVHPVKAEELGAVLLTHAEYLFSLAALQAEKKIDTGQTERKLTDIKSSILLLSQHKDKYVARIAEVVPVRPSTPYALLSRMPEGVEKYIMTTDGEMFGVIQVAVDNYFYIIVPLTPYREPSCHLGSDGKNLIAVYPEEIKKLRLPSSTVKLIEGANGTK